MNIQTQYSLQAHNSFGFDVPAERYVAVASKEELLAALSEAQRQQWPVFLLGGGSNLILTRPIAGLVIHLTDQHTEYEAQADGSTLVTAAAGKPWHTLVLETLERGLAGLENLSLIPGNTGAAPVQNIGAYGVELVDRLHQVQAYHRPSREWQTLQPSDCQFAYRDSIFKRHPGDYVITHVTLKLHPAMPAVTHYSALQTALEQITLPNENAQAARLISDTVIRIRQSKLPDPKLLGNAGSFFKNPVVSAALAQQLLDKYPAMVQYPSLLAG